MIGTTSPGNRDFVQALGADTVIDYTSTPFEQVVHDVDLILDTIGGETLQRSMQVVKPGGMVVSLLEQPPADLAQKYGIRASKNATPPTNDLLSAIAQLIAEGHVKPIVAQTFTLAEGRQAQEMSQRAWAWAHRASYDRVTRRPLAWCKPMRNGTAVGR